MRADAALSRAALWPLVRGYARFRRAVKAALGVHVKGLGFLLRRLRSDHQIEACGFSWFVDRRIAEVYASVLAGSFLEAETHSFLHFLSDHAPVPLSFVDVGANYGEMVVTMAAQPNVERVIAFEPHPVCAEVLTTNLKLNAAKGAEVHSLLIGDGTPQSFVIDPKSAALSGIRPADASVALAPTVRLDDILDIRGDCVLLIDVEGAELDVMRGAQGFVRQVKPLIIFEYHDGTRQRFGLDEVGRTLGSEYELFRLRPDGMLDRKLDSETWNCVAVNTTSMWATLCRRRTLPLDSSQSPSIAVF